MLPFGVNILTGLDFNLASSTSKSPGLPWAQHCKNLSNIKGTSTGFWSVAVVMWHVLLNEWLTVNLSQDAGPP